MLDPTTTQATIHKLDFALLEKFREGSLTVRDVLRSHDGFLPVKPEQLYIGASAWVLPAEAAGRPVALVSVGKDRTFLQLSSDSKAWLPYAEQREVILIPFLHVFAVSGVCKRCGRPDVTPVQACYGRPPVFVPRWIDQEGRSCETIAEMVAVDVTLYSLESHSRSPYEGNPSLDELLACVPHMTCSVEPDTDCHLFEDGSVIVSFKGDGWEVMRPADWPEKGWSSREVDAFRTRLLVPHE